MIKRVEYICEICRRRYDSGLVARECEAQGRPDTALVPIGCMDGSNAEPESFYADMVFAAASVRADNHRLRVSAWACRDTPTGDNVGKELCSGDQHFQRGRPANIDVKAPSTLRMIKELRKADIKPTVWDGEKAISWEEYRNNIGG